MITNNLMNSDFETLDLLGVGVGPFNMSLAALLSPVKSISAKFFDARNSFVWHEGQLMPDAEIQVTHLKDLVTLVDPTNPYSFLAYLKDQKRLYRFINSDFSQVLRMEFSQYFDWVSRSLSNLNFQESVQEIKFKKSCFVMQTSKRVVRGKNLSLGSGLAANIPQSAKPHLGENVYHIKDFLKHAHNWQGKRIAVIGGGQSGAEAIQSIISDGNNLPSQLTWISSRNHFAPMDESVFANEVFTPNHSEYFYGLSSERKAHLVKQHTLASDGISQNLLQAIYRRLYVLECIEQRQKIVTFLTNHTLVDVSAIGSNGGAHQLVLNEDYSGQTRVIDADIVILSTGYQWQFPAYLSGLSDKIPLDETGHFLVNKDFSIEWDGPSDNHIFVLNGARHSHGVADPNLSLMAWRSATIINSIAGREVYDLADESTAVDYQKLSPVSGNEPMYANGSTQVAAYAAAQTASPMPAQMAKSFLAQIAMPLPVHAAANQATQAAHIHVPMPVPMPLNMEGNKYVARM